MLEQKLIVFRGPRDVVIERTELSQPGPTEVLVRSLFSAISAGTESLVYRGELPDALTLDSSIASLGGVAKYPLSYGYSVVGIIEAIGSEIQRNILGHRVFAFYPHASRFVIPLDELILLPDSLSSEDAILLPNMETAVSLVMDGRPVDGELIVIFGQGIVGLLTLEILRALPHLQLVVVEPMEKRRAWARANGANDVLHDTGSEAVATVRQVLQVKRIEDGADLCYELSGQPDALRVAIDVTGYSGRIAIGSWYGTRQAPIPLGSRFHRSKITIRSCQVSELDAVWKARWTKSRRLNLALAYLQLLRPSKYITHVFPMEEAAIAYDLLNTAGTADTIQVIFRYT